MDGTAAGRSDNVYTKDFFGFFPADSFSPDQLHAVAAAAMTKWGEYPTYSVKGAGGSDRMYCVNFGSHRSQVFIDVMAYEDQARKKTRVHCMIRVIE